MYLNNIFWLPLIISSLGVDYLPFSLCDAPLQTNPMNTNCLRQRDREREEEYASNVWFIFELSSNEVLHNMLKFESYPYSN